VPAVPEEPEVPEVAALYDVPLMNKSPPLISNLDPVI
jgi:hypothetical protein